MENNLCIYCGSAVGLDARIRRGRQSGRARRSRDHGFGLVYGGGRVGLMGIVADAVLAGGGRAIGVIPEPLAAKEIAHDGLTELHVVRDMHERKALMASRSRAFLTLPGGIGTFEEFFETLSWAALGLHHKPMGVLNVAGYFDPLLALLDHAVAAAIRPARNTVDSVLVVRPTPRPIVVDLIVPRGCRASRAARSTSSELIRQRR